MAFGLKKWPNNMLYRATIMPYKPKRCSSTLNQQIFNILYLSALLLYVSYFISLALRFPSRFTSL